jgi:hypothetical protein
MRCFRSTGSIRTQVNIVPYAYDPTPLIQGEIDASLDFTTNVPYTISQQGVEAVSFLLYDYGFTIYNDTVVVTEEVLAEKRDLLVAWLRASRRGWDGQLRGSGPVAAALGRHLVRRARAARSRTRSSSTTRRCRSCRTLRWLFRNERGRH